ncbi:MAG: hypothetical protein ACRD8Z_03215 [Nitrososphaeraceae archaeon]
MKKNKLINENDIKIVLEYAVGLPSLENKFRSLANTILDLENKKKELSGSVCRVATMHSYPSTEQCMR